MLDPWAKSAKAPPKIAFLFLTKGKILHTDVWERYLADAESASVYVHSMPTALDHTFPDLPPVFRRALIPSVQTEYLKNLMHGMVQLLLYAHADARNAQFVFVSENSLPVKPFEHVYRELVNDTTSRFCISPGGQARTAWGGLLKHSPHPERVPNSTAWLKAELWSSLSRAHVDHLVANHDQVLHLARDYALHVGTRGLAAADELVLPTVLHQRFGNAGFNTCHGGMDQSASVATGCCITYTFWPDYSEQHPQRAFAPLFGDKSRCDGGCCPCKYRKLPEGAVRDLIRAPGFFFVRKIDAASVIIPESNPKATVPVAAGWLPLLEASGATPR